MIARWLSLVYEVDVVVASRWWSEKLKAAIHERVLARSLCDASSSIGPCGTPFRRPAGFRVSSVPAAVIARRRRFDVIMAWAIDRLGCSAMDLLGTIQTLEACGVDLYLDQQSIDATTPAGRLMFRVTGAFAEFVRSTIRQRVRGGLARAVEKGSVSAPTQLLNRGCCRAPPPSARSPPAPASAPRPRRA
jgi:hypothetical protein